MRAFDIRLVRLAVVAGAIVGSALVSSVAVATDESLPIEPSPTAPSDVASIDVDQSGADVIVTDPPPDAPFEDIAVIEIVAPEPEVVGPEVIDSAAPVDESTIVSTIVLSPEPMPVASLAMETTDPGAVEPEEPGGEHQGGSGGEGNPYRMTFTVIWFNADGEQITALDVVLPPEVLAQFELLATSQTGKGKATSATCTYPDGGTVLRCEFHNPGHGSGSDGLIIPARPTATYTVTVAWPADGWTISGADDVDYSTRDLCPRGGEGGGGGHESGGGEEGGGHESGGGEEGGESGGEGGSGVPCVHTVVLRQVAPAVPPPPPPPPPSEPPAPRAQDAGVIPPVVTSPVVTPTATVAEVQSDAAAPGSLPATGGSISMILLIAGVLVLMGSAAAGLTQRTS